MQHKHGEQIVIWLI